MEAAKNSPFKNYTLTKPISIWSIKGVET